MPFINCDSAREELYQCLEQSDAATKDLLSAQEILELPVDQFPSQCTALKQAFEDCLKTVVGEEKKE